jgi:hypothetical protein
MTFRFFRWLDLLSHSGQAHSGQALRRTASVDSVRFDTSPYEAGGEPRPGQTRVWFTPEGDAIGLYFFSVPPDLPANARSVDDLRAFFAAEMESSGGQVVELSSVRLDECPAVRVISKMPLQPPGMTCVGAFTIPFRDFSFVLKVQCEERGPTGYREAVLADRRLAAGEVSAITEGRMQLPNWNPDDESFDAEFPEHPVSRVRRVLSRVAASITFDASIKCLPGFALPEALA